MVSAALVHQNHPFTVEIPTNYRRTIPVSHRIKPSHTVVSATWYIKNTPVPARYDQLTDIVILELWSDDISRPLTCIHSRSERWISGQSLRHEQPLVVCRHAHHSRWRPGLGGDVELGSSLRSPRSRWPSPACPHRAAANLEWSACRENLITNAARA
jgi:hypothetical protein